ncbi:MAG: DUF732 domain-containing protein, partial [Acidimicrobiales bacterium]
VGRAAGTVAATLAAVLLAAACGGSTGPGAAATAAFLQAIHTADPTVNQQRPDQALVRLGEAACADFSSGASFTAVAEQLQSGPTGLTPEDIGSLLIAAVDDLCPTYRSQAGAP